MSIPAPSSRTRPFLLFPIVALAVALIATMYYSRATSAERWEYGQFYLFVWNDRASAGWYDGSRDGASVERTVVDSNQAHRTVLAELADELGCAGEARPHNAPPPEPTRLVGVLSNCLGALGWELVTATETLHDGPLSPEVLVGRTYLFKRKVK